ncbi:hypothetical protein [Nocardioides dilutus]
MTETLTEAPRRRRVQVAAPVIPASFLFRAGFALVTLATLVFRAVTTQGWSYLQDDWVFIAAADNTTLLEFVRQTNNDHLMPIGSFLIWVTTAYDPLDFTWVTVTTCVLTLAVMVGWGLALRELFGERFHLVGALVVIGFAPSIMPIGVWWCASLIYLPLQATIGFAIYFLTRHLLRGERRSDLLWLTLTVGVGLLFWQKAVLVSIPLAFVALIVGDGSLVQRLRRTIRVLWPSAVLIAIFLVFYLIAPRPELDTFAIDFPVGRSPGQIAEFYSTAAGSLVLPAMLGGPFVEMSSVLQPFSAADPALRSVLLIAAAAGTVLALVFRRRAWLMLLMSATYAAGAYGLVLFSSRYTDMGLPSLWENRYLADAPPVLMLGLMFLVTPLRTETTDEALVRPLGARPRLATKITLGGYLVLASALAVGVSVRNWDLTKPNSPRPWVDNLVTDAKAAGRANLYDTVAPDHVINATYMFGHANLSDLLRPLDLPITYNEPAPAMLVPTTDGELVEGEVSEPAAVSATGPQPECGYLVEPGKTTTILLSAEVYDYEWAVQLDYFSASDLDLTVSAGETDTVVPLSATQPGTIGRRIWVLVDSFDRLELTASGDQPFCVTQVAVGGLSPTDRRPASPD